MSFKIDPFGKNHDHLQLSDELVSQYSLQKWAKSFSLMTAGYRDQLDPDDFSNPKVPFNIVTVAICAEAKARVFKRTLAKEATGHVHLGGETRPHTAEFIAAMARIYVSNGLTVHLNEQSRTTPIWYTSFGTFYNNYHFADNLTASHSPFFKGGWKPVDSMGKQLLEQEQDIIDEVRIIISNRDTINFAPYLLGGNILSDFNVDSAYLNYLESMLTQEALDSIKMAAANGYRVVACPVGGSMQATTKRLFSALGIGTGIGQTVEYIFGEENLRHHSIGDTEEQNFGPDPGKWQIYKSIGAQQILLSKKANAVFLWDPDGDRFNIVTIAPVSIAKRAIELGLEVEQFLDLDYCIVYFSPNQIFLMLIAYRISVLKSQGLLEKYDWFIASSITTSRSLNELAAKENIPVAQVRVGFKYMGAFSDWLENQNGDNIVYVDPVGNSTNLGNKPRALIMCEESGGAMFGSFELLSNIDQSKAIIALREKDGMQFAMMTFALGAQLFNSDQSLAENYCMLIEKNAIKHKFFKRIDIRLYDESLSGDWCEAAKQEGILLRDRTMQFFESLATQLDSGTDVKDIRQKLDKSIDGGNFNFPPIYKIRHIGDGCYFEFDHLWFVIRASGTDAVLRYYVEGEDEDEMSHFIDAVICLKI